MKLAATPSVADPMCPSPSSLPGPASARRCARRPRTPGGGGATLSCVLVCCILCVVTCLVLIVVGAVCVVLVCDVCVLCAVFICCCSCCVFICCLGGATLSHAGSLGKGTPRRRDRRVGRCAPPSPSNRWLPVALAQCLSNCLLHGETRTWSGER